VDGDAVDQLHAAHRRAAGGRERGCYDDARAAGGAKGGGELGGDVAPKGGVELLADDAGVAHRARSLDHLFGGEARGPRAGVGVKGDCVEAAAGISSPRKITAVL
jgi:hypothetical protein